MARPPASDPAPQPFIAALVQMRSGTDRDGNVAILRELVAEAAATGARYVQTPEMTGAVQRDGRALLAQAVPMERDALVRAASEWAARHAIWLHVGSTALPAGRTALPAGPEGAPPMRGARPGLVNRALLFAPDGTLRATYDKLHMFDVDLPDGESWRESRLYRPGSRAVVADLAFPRGGARPQGGGPASGERANVRLGLGICYDLRFPALFRAQARAGASVLTAPAAFTARTGRAHWHVLARARAIECGAFVLAAAQGGRHEDGRETYGHSLAVSPWGEVIGELAHDEPGILSVRIDPAESAAARARIPSLDHDRDFVLDPLPLDLVAPDLVAPDPGVPARGAVRATGAAR